MDEEECKRIWELLGENLQKCILPETKMLQEGWSEVEYVKDSQKAFSELLVKYKTIETVGVNYLVCLGFFVFTLRDKINQLTSAKQLNSGYWFTYKTINEFLFSFFGEEMNHDEKEKILDMSALRSELRP